MCLLAVSEIHHPDDVLGALSLIIFSVTLLPLPKYVYIVLWANYNGDVCNMNQNTIFNVNFLSVFWI